MRSLIPWDYLVSRWARAQGFLDPIRLFAQVGKFSKPAQVLAPLELLRAGLALQARGLINSQAIQHNLDWVWPYWVVRQFDPRDNSFVPRAFNFSHINITHRNWTAVGLPDFDELSVVDPRGLVTPFLDGWSIDAWLLDDHGHALIPSRILDAEQKLLMDPDSGAPSVETRCRLEPQMQLVSRARVVRRGGEHFCQIDWEARSSRRGRLAVSLRPYNPEGVSFVHDIEALPDRLGWKVNGRARVEFGAPASATGMSDYEGGDVYHRIAKLNGGTKIHCPVGMATAAAVFEMEADEVFRAGVSIPLDSRAGAEAGQAAPGKEPVQVEWADEIRGTTRLSGGNALFRFLYDAAIRTLILHSPGDIYPGPYTYKRFWFRDAAYILQAMLCAGMTRRSERAMERFFPRQTASGQFVSQDGEWDSNGQVLWILKRYCELTGSFPKTRWRDAVLGAARWIEKKRVPSLPEGPHSGLLPAGFSAEHFGPNDYYYWDDFWSLSGLRAAKWLAREWGDTRESAEFERSSESLFHDLQRSIAAACDRLGTGAIPPSPYRRLDAACVGPLVASYPLRLYAAEDSRILETLDFLLRRCFVDGGFFLDMSHSGINPYLTLHAAQALLRAGDPRFFAAMDAVARLASPTGQWPEAIHPRTGGGCMGDGQHVWAAAEWTLMTRACFVREEGDPVRLVLGSGLAPGWFDGDAELSFGPTLTDFGPVTVRARKKGGELELEWSGDWRGQAPVIEIRVPGYEKSTAAPGETQVRLKEVSSCAST